MLVKDTSLGSRSIATSAFVSLQVTILSQNMLMSLCGNGQKEKPCSLLSEDYKAFRGTTQLPLIAKSCQSPPPPFFQREARGTERAFLCLNPGSGLHSPDFSFQRRAFFSCVLVLPKS